MAHKNKKQIAFYVTEEENEKIDKYSKKIGISRQALLSNILNSGLDDIAALNKYGILAIGVGLRDLLEKFKNKEIESILPENENIEHS